MCETLCKFLHLYASIICMFMQRIMINRKFGGISDFSAPSPQRTIFLLFRFSLFPSFEKTAENENRNEKSHIFAVFARKRPFLSQIKG
ncbi:hypothetical protein [Segatella copri]|uniref:hypothetical protein n=1 Tax=Segatella copri TaxID=165179 RepID=UPI001F415FA4|nr:hypothetical protein [Segatella copri]